MADARFRPFEDTHAVEMFPGVVRHTLVSGDRQTLIHVRLDAGAVVPEHQHPHEQAGTVVAGRIRLRIGDAEQELGANASYLIPGEQPHVVTALEATVLVEAFAPVREDFAAQDREA